MGRRGVTLVELMIVVLILGVLAGIALPTYSRTVERSYRQEAQDILYAVYQGERSYYLTNNAYYGPLTDTSSMSEWRTIYMDNPNLGSIPVTVAVSVVGATFTATTTRNGGRCDGRTITIDQNRTLGGTWPSSGDC